MMFNDKNQKHLKPLSKYAQRVFNEPVAHTSIHQFIKPPNNYENNATKTTAFCSPCVGCFVESPSLRKDPVACDGRRSVSSVIDNVDSPISSKCRAQNVAPSFDLDVDDILNLSPCGGSFQRVPDCGKKRKLDIGSASLHQNSAAAVDDKGMCPDVTTVNQNRGYGSCRTEDQTKPRNLCVSANQQLPRAAWRQLHLDCRDVREEFLSESFQVAETESGQHSSVLDLKVVMSGRPSTELAGSPSRGSVDDLWRVGLTMLTEDAIESPLQVKVRSVVIKKKDSCAMHSSPRSFYTTRGSPPPVSIAFDKKKCQKYVTQVKNHLQGPGALSGADVMAELGNLMYQVAGQASGSSSPPWQHPTDLTSRNFSKRFNTWNLPQSLDEWNKYNQKAGRRFAHVQNNFRTSNLE